jgi:hypothetical protein
MQERSRRNSGARLLPWVLVATAAALIAVLSGGGEGGRGRSLDPGSASSPSTGEPGADEPSTGRPPAQGRAEHQRAALGGRDAPETDGAAVTGLAPRARVSVDLLGRVVDGDGLAVPEAQVRLSAVGPDGQASAETTSACDAGDDGTFRIARAEWMGGELFVHVRARGHVVLQRSLTLAGDEDGDEDEQWLPDLVVERGVVLGGVVLDWKGDPVEGACVWRDSVGREDTLEELRFVMGVFGAEGAGVGLTDVEGRFELPNEEIGPFELRVAHGAHPELCFEGVAPTAGVVMTELLLRLAPAASIEGRVRGWPGDRPGVVVRAEPTRARDSLPRTLAELIEAAGLGRGRMGLIAPGGTFTIEGLEPRAPYEVQVIALGQNGLQREACSAAVNAVAGGRAVELKWEVGAVVAFQARSEEAGTPLREVRVRYTWRVPEARGRERAFPSGSVELDGLRPSPSPGLLDLVVSAADHLPLGRQALSVPAGGRVELGQITLRRAPRLHVVVLDQRTDEPLDEAVLAARPAIATQEGAHDAAPAPVKGESDREGRCELTLAFSGAWVLEVGRDGFATETLEGLSAPGDLEASELVVRLRRGGAVSVRVLDEEEHGVERATVHHRDPDGVRESRRAEGSSLIVFSNLSEGLHHFRAVHGRSDVLSVQEGPWTADDDAEWSSVLVRAGGAETLVLRVPTLTALEGRVLARGVPAIGAAVTFLLGENHSDGAEHLAQVPQAMTGMLSVALPRTRTDGDGRFSFDDLPVGAHRLRVVGSQGAPPVLTVVEIRPGLNVVEIELPLGAIEGHVVDLEGLPVARAVVRALRAPSGPAESVDLAAGRRAAMDLFREGRAPGQAVRLDGSFHLDGIPAEVAIVLEVYAEGFVDLRTDSLTLSSGEVRGGLRLALVPGGAIVVIVKGPVHPLLKVWARSAGPPVESRLGFAGGGLVELRELRPGHWIVSLADEAGAGEGVAVEVHPWEQTWVELVR